MIVYASAASHLPPCRAASAAFRIMTLSNGVGFAGRIFDFHSLPLAVPALAEAAPPLGAAAGVGSTNAGEPALKVPQDGLAFGSCPEPDRGPLLSSWVVAPHRPRHVVCHRCERNCCVVMPCYVQLCFSATARSRSSLVELVVPLVRLHLWCSTCVYITGQLQGEGLGRKTESRSRQH